MFSEKSLRIPEVLADYSSFRRRRRRSSFLPRLNSSQASMEARDVILGHILVERGWLGPEELEACRRECASSVPLSRVVVHRRAIPKEELDALWADITKVVEHGADPAHDEQEDLLLGQYLRSTHQLSADHLLEAQAARRSLGKADIVPRLAEVLLEKGHAT